MIARTLGWIAALTIVLNCDKKDASKDGGPPGASAATTSSASVATPAESASSPPPHASASAAPVPPANVAERVAATSVAWAPNGRSFAWAVGARMVIAPSGGGAPIVVASSTRPIGAMAWSPRGDVLASIDDLGVAQLADARGNVVAKLPDGLASEPRDLSFSSDGKLLAALGDGKLVVWSAEKRRVQCTGEAPSMFWQLAITRDQGSVIATGAGGMSRFDASTCKARVTGGADTGGTFGSWVSPDGELLSAAGGDGHELQLYDAKSFQRLEVLAHSSSCSDHITFASFSRDGQILLASGSGRWIKTFRVASRKTIASYDVPSPDAAELLLVYDDGERALIQREKTIELVSLVSKSVAATFDAGDARRFDLAWDMKRLVAAGPSEAIVRDASTGKELAKITMPR